MQITMSPYYGEVDFSAVADAPVTRRQVDPVSVADILRNGFVYPPNSVYEGVKLVTFGFSNQHDMHRAPVFQFKFREAGKSPGLSRPEDDWVGQWHRRLCEAVARSSERMRAPWQLQSGGKDSTTLAIAIAEARPETVCLTYLGGREEDEVASARHVARTLGLRHESLVCDPGRAWDRYVAIAHRMPLLTADFALLSYVDLATEVAANGGDGVFDGLGSDSYFGTPVYLQKRMLSWLARGWRLPEWVNRLPLVERSFVASFLLGTLQMHEAERVFPGSRFTDAEVDGLFGMPVSERSRARLAPYRPELSTAISADERLDMLMSIAGSAGAFAKGLYTCSAVGLQPAYPFCQPILREWVYRDVPRDQLIDPERKQNKVLVRRHIESRFASLPYVGRKGSFRFDVRGLARLRFDEVRDVSLRARELLPGATTWLDRNRRSLDNKYHASKFYLLAVVLPWLAAREARAERPEPRAEAEAA